LVYCYIVERVENNVVTQLEHNAAVRRQQAANAANTAQSAAFWALRSGGKAEAAAQMANPISTQTFNTKQGTYVVEGRSTSGDARAAAEQRTLDLALEKQRQQKEQTLRMARINAMISISENNNNLPHYDAQNQRSNNNISNNNVNPAALFTPQPVNSNNNSQNSSVSGGINANANYNYATAMNDFQTANPTGQVNMGESAQAWGYTAGKSSIPIENEVKTSLLGGDIQHQESDINTNVSYLPEMNDPQDTIGSSINLGGAGIAIAGLGALLLMGKIK